MSSLKMYNFNPQPKGLTLPNNFSVSKFKSDEDIASWVEICSDGLIDSATGYERFDKEIANADGPNPYSDTYFIENNGKKIATFTVVTNMWSTGLGNLHMVACKSEYRGLGIGKFIADYSLQLLKERGIEKIFLLTHDQRIPAIKSYLNAGYLPVNYIDDDGKDMIERWQNIVNQLKTESLTMLDEKGEIIKILRYEE